MPKLIYSRLRLQEGYTEDEHGALADGKVRHGTIAANCHLVKPPQLA